jgi:DNA invertase Pin-like site-specific DNA recombinase
MMRTHSGGAPGILRPEKITSRHLERLAVVYVRQSTVQQVLEHQESTRLQYGLQRQAEAWGWPAERVLLIDEDLGKSGASAEGRSGFQRLVSEVGLGHVGLILGVEMSRLARSSKDWHQLLELCALFGALIADLDGVYNPAEYNDRLLLGLKGTMSEAELHLLRQRLHQGKLNKARRGELGFRPPLGYVRGSTGEIVRDPDEQVQEVVRLVFRKFEELGTLSAVLRYLVEHGIKLGIRTPERGNREGRLEWRRPSRMTLQNVLKHPIYAGAYVYGRRQMDPRRQQAGRPGTGRVVQAAQEWYVLRRDEVPAYLSWEQYERNQARLRANRTVAEEEGAVRGGEALLVGRLVCLRCGQRLSVRYAGSSRRPTYLCDRARVDYGEPLCQQLAGPALDAYVSHWLLRALEPASLELALQAAENLEQEREALRRLWQQRRERAAYEAERAARQYQRVEPENRLVARQLESAWEEKLRAQQKLEEDYRRFLQEQPRRLSEAEQGASGSWRATSRPCGGRRARPTPNASRSCGR